MRSAVVLGLLSLVSAAPAGGDEQYPEVVPGPGLPSLEELGVTSAELYQMPLPEFPSAKSLTARQSFHASCGPDDARYTNVNGLIACFHYLQKLGTKQCRIAHESSQFCYSGDARVVGQAANLQSASSYCRDVATGLLWTIDNCTRPDQSCAGYQTAAGNGNLIVVAGSKRVLGG